VVNFAWTTQKALQTLVRGCISKGQKKKDPAEARPFDGGHIRHQLNISIRAGPDRRLDQLQIIYCN
jgi:hypothetical protein